MNEWSGSVQLEPDRLEVVRPGLNGGVAAHGSGRQRSDIGTHGVVWCRENRVVRAQAMPNQVVRKICLVTVLIL